MVGLDETDDYKCNGSVLEKLSLFEKLEQRQANAMGQLPAVVKPQMPAHDIDNQSNMKRAEYLSKSMRSIDKDPGD